MKNSKFSKYIFLASIGFSLVACQGKRLPIDDDDGISNVIEAESGDIVVSNGGSDSVLLLDKNGNFKDVLLNVDNTSETVWGIEYLDDTDEVAVVIDGVDRVKAVSLSNLSARDLILNANLTGILKEITQLVSGDLLIAEASNVELFTINGVRITSGGWPKALQTGASGIDALDNGGFVHCSTTADVVRTYDSAGIQVATAVSGIAATTDSVACIELKNGNIAVAWSGTTDTIQILSADLSTVIASYSDTGQLGSPSGLAQAKNGNILIGDAIFHHIVEITQSGNFVKTLAGALINTPRDLLVIP